MPDVTIATLNLFNKIGRWGERAPLVVEQWAELQPDIVGLQEVDLTIDQAVWLCHLINSRKAGPGVRRYRAYHVARPGRAAHVQAIAVVTWLDVEAHEGLDYLSNEGVAQRLRVRVDGTALDFYNTHLHFPPESTGERVEQANKLLAWRTTWPSQHTAVIAGDFNAYPGEAVLDLMKQHFVSAHEAHHGREPETTWPTPVNTFDPAPPGCLDYIFVSGARVVEAARVFDKPHPLDATLFPSDHMGVMAKLALP
jgi:endonuclease/exonuclease/phosphatase family metal-dependent hydrolase